MKRREAIKQWALDQVGCPYVYGGTGNPCVPSYRKARMDQYPDYASAIKKNCPVLSGKQSACSGCKYNGKPCYDCAQLTRYAAAAAGLSLPSGASSQWKSEAWKEKGIIDDMPRGEVCFLYKHTTNGNPMGHTGIYLGDGTACDARGHASGVMHVDVESYKWTHYAVLPGMDDECNDSEPPAKQSESSNAIVRRGNSGASVTKMQMLLIRHGYSLPKYGADGSFGSETLTALLDFQRQNGLDADGICGADTWAVLESAPDDSPDPMEDRFTITIPDVDAATATYLLECYPQALSEKSNG
jgi:hypothetical protein